VLAPAAFIERRNALAARARREGDEQVAARIKAIRRPTVGAAIVNALVRERGEVMSSLHALGAELRDAQACGNGPRMRNLLGRRQELMRVLDLRVVELASERGLTATRAVLQDVHATMLAALSDPQAEAIVRSGRLESALTDGTFADSPPAATTDQNEAIYTDAEPVGSSSTRRIESAQLKLHDANASATAADEAVEELAAAVINAQHELADLDSELEETLKRAWRIERDTSTADRKVTTAQDAHADAVRRAKALREAAAKAKAAYEHKSVS
jgi:hypothetical protein